MHGKQEDWYRQRASDREDPFDEFFDAHFAGVERYVRARLNRDSASVDDVCTEVFLTAWERFDRHQLGELAPSAARRWLLRVAKNKCFHAYRSGFRRLRLVDRLTETVDIFAPDAIADELLDSLGGDELLAHKTIEVLDELPARHRKVIELDLEEPPTGKELAAALDVTHAAARLRRMRARREFAATWERRFGRPWPSEGESE